MPVAHVAAKIVLVVFVIWFVFTYVFAAFQVNGNVMYPSIRTGDLLLAYRLQGDYVQDDVVLFRYNDVTRVARIVAQGGDVVELTDDGDLVVNGNVQQEDIFYPTEEQSTLLKYPYVVPENSYFLLCDYRTAAQDSRDFGAVSQDDIVGKVITLLRRRGI
jgi:signal peptidase I